MTTPPQIGLLRRYACLAVLCAMAPVSLLAQVRTPDPVTPGTRATSRNAKRTELLIGGGVIGLKSENATKSSVPIGSIAFRKQFSPEWLYLGATADVGRTPVDGSFFPYERRPFGDTTRFVQVNGNASVISVRANADGLWPLNEDETFRAGLGLTAGAYGVGSLVAPQFGANAHAQRDLTRRLSVTALVSYLQFISFDREKIRPSDPALAEPVFRTPLNAVPDPEKSFSSTRFTIGIAYRLGVKTVRRGAR
jgi:hypothetical protein